MTDLLALDLATVSGFARGRVGERPISGRVRFGKGGDHARIFGTALVWMEREFADAPDIIVVEAMLPPTAMTNETSRATRDMLAGLRAIVLGMAHLRGVPRLIEAPVNTIREHFIGDRMLPRRAAKAATQRRCADLGYGEVDEDTADALACWHYGASLVRPELALETCPLFNSDLRE